MKKMSSLKRKQLSLSLCLSFCQRQHNGLIFRTSRSYTNWYNICRLTREGPATTHLKCFAKSFAHNYQSDCHPPADRTLGPPKRSLFISPWLVFCHPRGSASLQDRCTALSSTCFWEDFSTKKVWMNFKKIDKLALRWFLGLKIFHVQKFTYLRGLQLSNTAFSEYFTEREKKIKHLEYSVLKIQKVILNSKPFFIIMIQSLLHDNFNILKVVICSSGTVV